jgi:hypothetical protein
VRNWVGVTTMARHCVEPDVCDMTLYVPSQKGRSRAALSLPQSMYITPTVMDNRLSTLSVDRRRYGALLKARIENHSCRLFFCGIRGFGLGNPVLRSDSALSTESKCASDHVCDKILKFICLIHCYQKHVRCG